MKKLILAVLVLGGCSSYRYTVTCKDAPTSHDVYGSNVGKCELAPSGTIVVVKTKLGFRTYYIDRCDGYRVVRWKRIKGVK